MSDRQETASVLSSFVEYRASYQEPIFEHWFGKGTLAAPLFRAFREWGVTLRDITGNLSPSNAEDVRLNVDLLNSRARFTVGLGGMSFFAVDPHWNERATLTAVATAGMEAIHSVTGVQIQSQNLVLGLHFRPEKRSVLEITSGFIRTDKTLAGGKKVRGYGLSAYSEDGAWNWVIDVSFQHPNALFARLGRTAGPESSIEKLVTVIQKDQGELFGLLELRIP